MILTPLSLVRATHRVPPVPTNAERAALLRAALPAPRWNTHDWSHGRGTRYAMEQGLQRPIPFNERRG